MNRPTRTSQRKKERHQGGRRWTRGIDHPWWAEELERRVLLSTDVPGWTMLPSSDSGQWLAFDPIAQGQSSPVEATAAGTARVMILRVRFADYANTSRYTQAQVQGLMGEINQLYQNTSYGNMSIDAQVSSLIALPDNRSAYVDDFPDGDLSNGGKFDKVLLDAINNAPAGLDWSDLDSIMVLMAETDPAQFHRGQGTSARTLPQGPGGPNKTVGAAIFSENPSDSDRAVWGRMAHEVGHAFQAGGPAHPSNYNSAFELMDANYPGQTGVFEKQAGQGFPGWLPTGKYQEFTPAGGGGVASIFAEEYDPALRPNVQAVKAKITDNLYYLISVRRRVLGDDLNAFFSPNGIPDEGVLIERVVEGASQWVTVQGRGGNRNQLWHEGDRYDNSTDGISILVGKKIDDDNYFVTVRYNVDVAHFPDVGLHPWTSPPGNTWETTDIWVDSPANGYGTFRYGSWSDLSGNSVPRLNGDPPAVGLPNRVYARVRNMGTSTATNVKVHFEITDPLGVGIAGANGFVPLGSVDSTGFPGLAAIAPGAFEDVYVDWTPDVTIPEDLLADGLFDFHSCLRVKIDPVAGETVLANQDGDREQENITDFQAVPESEGGDGRPFDQVIHLRNDNRRQSQYFYLSVLGGLPDGWKLNVNDGRLGVLLGPDEVADIPVKIDPSGPAELGGEFGVDVVASRQVEYISDLDPKDRHYEIEELGGVHVAARVLRKVNLDADVQRRGPNEIEVRGKFNVQEFERFYSPRAPFHILLVGRDAAGNFLPATQRVVNVQPDATFDGFLGVDPQHGEPTDVVALFAGTQLLSSARAGPLQVQPTDFGDAPAPFPTRLADNGARHRLVQGFFLGGGVDAEQDGQPDAAALGDDTHPATAPDDEDGVTFTTPLTAGAGASIGVVASAPGVLDAWIDFNGNGSWADPGERIFATQPLNTGNNTLSFAVPAGAKTGDAYARFRYSINGVQSFDGPSTDGEVEDYRVRIEEPQPTLDFGDAPTVYPTVLGANGARHRIVQGFFLGGLVDPERDGQPSGDALGDDNNPAAGPDDEDGVAFLSPLIAGAAAQVEVVASAPGILDAWIDFNGNGSWADAGERIYTTQPLNPGPNVLAFAAPAGSNIGRTFARFRFSRNGVPSFDGPAPDGEVEDYAVEIKQPEPKPMDFGDAPTIYPTTLATNGARHQILDGFFLGRTVDAERDGQPTVDALGDDNNPAAGPDDEDGVVFVSPLVAGSPAQVQVTASAPGVLDAWIDFNGNGSWADPGERIFTTQPLNAGANALLMAIPASAKAGATYARFRYSINGVPSFVGAAPDGEVEDYQVRIQARPGPRVTGVFVRGSTWGQSFMQELADKGIGDVIYGFSIPAGAGQLDELPWSNLDRISVRFDSDVDVEMADLSVRGVNRPNYPINAFAYDAATRTATWSLVAAPANDKFLLDLNGDGGGVSGAGGGPLLDGDWTDGVSAYPSGDGAAGGDFRFRLNALPADVDRSGGAVNATDLVLTRNRIGRSVAHPGAGPTAYSAFNDVNGDAIINAPDLVLVRNRIGTALPGPNPSLRQAALMFSVRRVEFDVRAPLLDRLKEDDLLL